MRQEPKRRLKMIDKEFCMSSYLAFRYIEKDGVEFSKNTKHKKSLLPDSKKCSLISSEIDLNIKLEEIFNGIKEKKIGILLSGGMDSACLAAYMPKGSNAYTFRFLNGEYDSEELRRAEIFANKCELNLKYVDIDWNVIKDCLHSVMGKKGAPVHSIEPQLYRAALQAKTDGVELLIIGDAADYVFYGMDGLLSKDWDYDEFVNRVIYVNPEEVLVNPVSMNYLFERYRLPNGKIDFIKFYDESITEESYGSYENAFDVADIAFIDPYEYMKMSEKVDLRRIRAGESKYFIRSLFKMKYPDIPLPEKHPMPRPVDFYFKDWAGPTRPEFKKNLDMSKFTGNQKWQIWCLEQFLNDIEKNWM